MGESTTGTGRQVLLHQGAEVCKILDGEYKMPDNITFAHKVVKGVQKMWWHYGYSPGNAVVYGDTDSDYFLTYTDNTKDAIKVADYVGRKVSKSFKKLMQDRFLCQPGFDDIMDSEREIVSDRGIFVDKKRYILHIVNADGWECDKLKVMGLDTKKTTLPKEVSSKINNFVERYLKGEDWDVIARDIVDYKDEMINTTDVMSIGLPKGVQKVELYTKQFQNDPSGKLPGHVAASIMYNLCLEKYNDNESPAITSGMKIKVFYLNKTYGKFKSIAIPVDIETVPQWFLDNYTIDRDAHITRLIDKPLGNIIKAIGKDSPSKQSLFVDDVLIF